MGPRYLFKGCQGFPCSIHNNSNLRWARAYGERYDSPRSATNGQRLDGHEIFLESVGWTRQGWVGGRGLVVCYLRAWGRLFFENSSTRYVFLWYVCMAVVRGWWRWWHRMGYGTTNHQRRTQIKIEIDSLMRCCTWTRLTGAWLIFRIETEFSPHPHPLHIAAPRTKLNTYISNLYTCIHTYMGVSTA